MYPEKPRNRGFVCGSVAYVLYEIDCPRYSTTSIYLQSAYSVYRNELLMTKIIFAMYNPKTDCIEDNLYNKIYVSFNCQKHNASVRLDESSDIAYLIRLAREEPVLYAKFAFRDGGLQRGVEAMGIIGCLPSLVYIIVIYN